MTGLGNIYEHGWGAHQDYSQAAAWYRNAAEAGNAIGMNNLGVMYENGSGVQQDKQQATYWSRKAAQQEIRTRRTISSASPRTRNHFLFGSQPPRRRRRQQSTNQPHR